MSRSHIDLRSLSPKRVCLIKPSSLGDVVHAFPVASALRDLWPDASLSWVVNRGLRSLIDGHPCLDEIIPFDRARARFTPSGVTSTLSFAADLRRRRFDLAIDLQGLLRSAVMTLATGARVRVGLADAREGATAFYTHRIAMPEGPTHAVDRLLRVCEALGADIARPRFVAAMSDEDRRWARAELARVARPSLLLNLGARWLTKRWPPAQFAEVARLASRRFGAGLVAVGAPEDQPLVEELRAALGPDLSLLDLCGRTTLPQLAALAAEADIFLSNDTGPLHLAAAAGARVVGVYTCTDPDLTGPYGERAIAVQSRVWCAKSCVKLCDRLDCMTELTPARVWEAVEAQLLRASTSHSAA